MTEQDQDSDSSPDQGAPYDGGLLDFTQATYGNYTPKPYHRALASALEQVERGEITRLMIFCPPRHGKSELASVRFPAWYLGRNPDKKLIAASYGAGQAYKFSRKARNLMQSPAYRRLFPGSRVASDAGAVQFWALENLEGQYAAAGIGGPITGEGADCILIDDPVKDHTAAMSLTIRENAYDWYVSTAYTRLNDERGAIILIQTRWHEDDLAGRLLQEMADGGDQWTVIRFPALAEADDPLGREEGEALWPERFSTAALERTRHQNSMWFEAQYQQKPPEMAGGRFFRMWSPTKGGDPYHVWPEDFARERYSVAEDKPFPPRHWHHWAAVDGGVRDAWAVLWAAQAPDNRTIVYREVYEAGVEVPDQAKRLKKLDADYGASLVTIQADPAMFTRRANMTVSDADVYRNYGVGLVPGTNTREPGWRRLREALGERDDGYPGLVVLEGATPNLVRTLPRLTADPDKPEDIEDGQEDHAADALRYLVMPAAVTPVSRKGTRIVVPDMQGRIVDDGDDSEENFAASRHGGVASGWR